MSDKEVSEPVTVIAELTDHTDRSLLIVEDDKPFLERLSRAMETRGFTVTSCDSVSDGLAQIGRAAPAFAVVDLRLGDGNRRDGGEDGRGGLSFKARRRRRRGRGIAGERYREVRTAAQSNVGRSRALGAYPAHL